MCMTGAMEGRSRVETARKRPMYISWGASIRQDIGFFGIILGQVFLDLYRDFGMRQQSDRK